MAVIRRDIEIILNTVDLVLFFNKKIREQNINIRLRIKSLQKFLLSGKSPTIFRYIENITKNVKITIKDLRKILKRVDDLKFFILPLN